MQTALKAALPMTIGSALATAALADAGFAFSLKISGL